MKKSFKTYEEAYALYAEIVAGRDPDRMNATITYIRGDERISEAFIVYWMAKNQ